MQRIIGMEMDRAKRKARKALQKTRNGVQSNTGGKNTPESQEIPNSCKGIFNEEESLKQIQKEVETRLNKKRYSYNTYKG